VAENFKNRALLMLVLSHVEELHLRELSHADLTTA